MTEITDNEARALAICAERARAPKRYHLHKVSFEVRPHRKGDLALWSQDEWDNLVKPVRGRAPKAKHHQKAYARKAPPPNLYYDW